MAATATSTSVKHSNTPTPTKALAVMAAAFLMAASLALLHTAKPHMPQQQQQQQQQLPNLAIHSSSSSNNNKKINNDDTINDAIQNLTVRAVGRAAYLFVQASAYRTSPQTFSVVGLASKPLHIYSNAYFSCRWLPRSAGAAVPVHGTASKILPDWGLGRVYTAVVVLCDFPTAVGADASGGHLILAAYPGGDRSASPVAEIRALTEPPGRFDPEEFSAEPRFEFVHCGSPLFGEIEPARLREWVAYHAKLFGERGHLAFHDAGGLGGDAVRRVLGPWVRKGVVSVKDVSALERFDGHYHNQFVVLNDCLLRFRQQARWIFVFDVDEFLFVDQLRVRGSLQLLMDRFRNYSQVTFAQRLMSVHVCLARDSREEWGFEKFTFTQLFKGGQKYERKYALQPRYAEATGVHISEDISGITLNNTESSVARYYHFHGYLDPKFRGCVHNVSINDNGTSGNFSIWGYNMVFDPSLRNVAASVKSYELQTVGDIDTNL